MSFCYVCVPRECDEGGKERDRVIGGGGNGWRGILARQRQRASKSLKYLVKNNWLLQEAERGGEGKRVVPLRARDSSKARSIDRKTLVNACSRARVRVYVCVSSPSTTWIFVFSSRLFRARFAPIWISRDLPFTCRLQFRGV